MISANLKSVCSIGVVLGAVLTQAACSDGAVYGDAVGINQTTQALTAGELLSVNGTYGASCSNRTGAWSLEIAALAAIDNPTLSVDLNDASCVLTLTDLRTSAGIVVAIPAIVLTTSYQATASSFGTPIGFYANAKLSAVTFASDFVLSILYSDDPTRATSDNTAQFDVAIATATAANIPSPSYTLAVDGLLVRTDVNNIVQSVIGTADLTAGAVAGQNYVVVGAAVGVTYADLDTAFTAGTKNALVLAIPAADFTLGGSDLTANQVRTLIIANTQDGVASYEAFAITFHPAP